MLVRQEQTNIRLAYILTFFGYLYFPASAWLFFYSRYVSYAEVALLAAIGGLASTILEIPTGAFADIVGRRIAIILSYVLYTVAMFGEAYSQTFIMFALFTVIASLVNSLYSGSLEALIYDTLKEDGHEDQYDRIISKMESISWLALLVGAMFGGFMYNYWFRLPFIAQGIGSIIAAIAAWYLVEPRIDTFQYKFSDIVTQNVQGFKELFRNTKVTFASLLFIILDTAFYISASLLGISQAIEYGLDPAGVSVLFSIGYLISAIVSYKYPSINKILGTRKILILTTFLLMLSFLLAQFVGLLLGCILIIARIASSTLASNTRSIVLNRYISSRNRATSLSTMVLLSHLPYTIGAYFIGIYIEETSPNTFAFILGLIISSILLLHSVLAKVFMKKK